MVNIVQQKESPNVSIIIPVYNNADEIRQALDSILGQSYFSWETIIINDASTDDTEIICREYAVKDKRFHVISNGNNLGPGASRNAGLAIAKGKYIVFVDGDDRLPEDSLLKRVVAIEENQTDMCIFNHKKVFGNGKTKENLFGNPGVYCKEDVLKRICLMESGRAYELEFVWDKIFRKDIIEKNGIKFRNEMRGYEDWIFLVDYIKKCSKIGIYEEITYKYYVVKPALAIQTDDCEKYFRYLKEYLTELNLFHDDTKMGFYHLYLNRMIGNLYRIVQNCTENDLGKEQALRYIKDILFTENVHEALISYQAKNEAEDSGILELIKHKDEEMIFDYIQNRLLSRSSRRKCTDGKRCD